MLDEGFLPRLAVSGIGSMPHADAGRACDVVLENLAQGPHWPQLPQLSVQERFCSQYLGPLARLGLVEPNDSGGRMDPGGEGWLEGQTEFYDTYLRATAGDAAALEAFAFPAEAAAGFEAFRRRVEAEGPGDALWFKGQVSGPLTVGCQVTDAARKAAFYDPSLRDLIVRAIEGNAAWQVHRMAALGRPVVLFVDEPGLPAFGQSTHVGLRREDIQAGLEALFAAIRRAGGVPGVHVCARCDWSLLYETQVTIVHLDAYGYLDSLLVYTRELAAFLERGGCLGWGLVPTSTDAWSETVDSLCDRFEAGLQSLSRHGVPRGRLLEQSLITPTCGTGTLAVDLAEHIYRLTGQVGAELRRRYL